MQTRTIKHYTAFNLSAPGQNTAIVNGDLGSRLSPKADRSTLRIAIALTTASVLNYTCTDGTTTHKWGVNGSVALNAGDLYEFVLPFSQKTTAGVALTYDFEIETDGVVEFLLCEEIFHAHA